MWRPWVLTLGQSWRRESVHILISLYTALSNSTLSLLVQENSMPSMLSLSNTRKHPIHLSPNSAGTRCFFQIGRASCHHNTLPLMQSPFFTCGYANWWGQDNHVCFACLYQTRDKCSDSCPCAIPRSGCQSSHQSQMVQGTFCLLPRGNRVGQALATPA